MASVVCVITHPEGLEEDLNQQLAVLDVGLESPQELTAWAIDVVQGRIPADSVDAMLVAQQASPDQRARAKAICEWFVGEIGSVITDVREDSQLTGPIFLDRWSDQGDLLLAVHPS